MEIGNPFSAFPIEEEQDDYDPDLYEPCDEEYTRSDYELMSAGPPDDGNSSYGPSAGPYASSPAITGRLLGSAAFAHIIPDYMGPDSLVEAGVYDVAALEQLVSTRPDIWIVEDLFMAYEVCLIASEPKAGKSTMARTLAIEVARGGTFLGRKCLAGPVVYYSLEDRGNATHRVIKLNYPDPGKRFGLPIHVVEQLPFDNPEADVLQHMVMMWNRVKPKLFIIDLITDALHITDVNDYTQVKGTLRKYRDLLVKYGIEATVVAIHHTRKPPPSKVRYNEAGAGKILGSQAFHGTVFTAMTLTVDQAGIRQVETSQKDGRAFDYGTQILLDPNTQMVRLPTSDESATLREKAEEHGVASQHTKSGRGQTNEQKGLELAKALHKAETDQPGVSYLYHEACRLTAREYKTNKPWMTAAVNSAVENGWIIREGKGGSATDPFRLRTNPTWRPRS